MTTLLGLDIGTLGVKGIVVGLDGQVLAQARRSHSVSRPFPGWAEQDAERDWWDDAAHVLGELLASPAVRPEEIAAIGVCGLTPCLCLLDETGLPVRPAILYSDNRALGQLERANTALGATWTAQAVTPKWQWLAEHEPEAAGRAQTLLSSHNYVVFRLTGERCIDYDTASIIGGVFDVKRCAWDEDACVWLGLDPDLLPPARPVTAVAGATTRAAQAETGLPTGIPVIAGTGDTFPTLVGCGAVTAGDAMISLGTTGLLTLTTSPLLSAVRGPHFAGAGGSIVWAANLLACGGLLAWFQEKWGGGRSFAELDQAAERVAPGAEGLVALPHLLGRRTPVPLPEARGVLFGLTPAHGPDEMYRGLLEAVGYAMRRGYEPVADQVRRLVVTAGGAASPLWRQVLADIVQRPVEYCPQSSGALGIAYLAALGTGIAANFDPLLEQWLGQTVVVEPDSSTRNTYDRLFRQYCRLDDALSDLIVSR